ncbi:MAG: hypothetical protein K2Y27_17490 [Xanthobacteraceae bacterium]|nr:hypothetical protein [Xanthobacteraceae bacterium]
MRAFLAVLFLLASVAPSLAEIRAGAIRVVRPNSIWFEDATKLTEWQKLRKSSGVAAFISYQKSILTSREARQFINPRSVKTLGYERRKNQITVEMKSEGRLQGSTWFLDASALTH